MHAFHLQKADNVDPWLSFSFLIEGDGKKVVYSGDIGTNKFSDVDEAVGDYCDALIIETGHQKIEWIHNYKQLKNIGKVFITHCGRAIINDVSGAKKKVEELFGNSAVICEDEMVVDLGEE